jgi:mono/diheme cytochrome c family protein
MYMRPYLVLTLLLISSSVQAFPPLLKEYSKHPQAKAEFKQDCSLCHIAPGGGGERNEFGEAFAREGAAFTKELIKKFPDRFEQSD